jgi:hypothetical protein
MVRSAFGLICCALVFMAGAAHSEQKSRWDGVWAGSFGAGSAVSVSVADGHVIKYLYRGAPLPISYSRVEDAGVKFGDNRNYSMSLRRADGNAARAIYNGRHGAESALLKRQ